MIIARSSKEKIIAKQATKPYGQGVKTIF